MHVEAFENAVSEAKRFLRLASGIKIEKGVSAPVRWVPCGTKKTGALRRASMDLTRALAEMRKP